MQLRPVERTRSLCLALALAASLLGGRAVAESASLDAVQGGVVMPRVLDAPAADYPVGAHGEAVVELAVLVGEDGRVSEVEVRAGEPPFDVAARAAVEGWRFAPAMRNNVPVRARILVKLSFRQRPPAQQVVSAPAPTALPSPVASAPPAAPDVEITIQGEQHEALGAIHVPRGDARLIPGAFADPFRVVEILPGVAPVLSGLPYFFVRGAPPGDVGYFIDGIRVPLLFHVGAGPSVIAPALVDHVELIPSAYPVRFGRYAGGIMAGDTTRPSSVGRAEAQARVFDAGAMVEQPFADGRGSALLAGRYSYTQALLSQVAPDYALAYWDYQARLAYRLSRKDRVTLFGFGAFDHLGNQALEQTLFEVQFHRLDLRWDHESETARVRLALTLGRDERLNADEGEPGPGARSNTEQVGVRLEADQRFSRELQLRAGFDTQLSGYATEYERRGATLSVVPPRTDGELGLFAEVALRPRAGFEIVPGVRLDVTRSRGETLLFPEPRLATRVELQPGLAWLSGFGLAHQLPSARVFVPGGQAGPLEMGVQRAYQASQGVELALPAAMYTRVSVFHSWLETRELLASARNYGLELFLRRDFGQKLGGFLSYTLSRTERTLGAATGLSSFDRPHVVSAVLGYDLGAGFRLGGRAYYASGRRYFADCPTPDCGPGDPEAPRPHLFEGRLAGFFRLDTRFEKRWRFASGGFVAATFEWFNALLAEEVSGKYWDPVRGGLALDTRDPLTLPSIGIEAGY